MEKITFCIPSKSNLQYLKSCIPSIRKNSYKTDHDIIVFVDSDEDGTINWLNEIKNQYNIEFYVNPNLNKSLYGIGKAYDFCIKKSKTDIFMIFHADMILGKHADLHLFNHLKNNNVVCSTRIEPPLHPNNGEKILMDFGLYPESFDENEFNTFIESNINNNQITTGIFAPWMMYKSSYIEKLGGHDITLHSCREDSDIFNRMLLSNFNFKQVWSSLVYHFTGRGAGSFTQDKSRHEKWKAEMQNSTLEFIRKWKSTVNHTPLMKPIVSNRYDIGFIIHNCTYELLPHIEPWCDTLYSTLNYSNYINSEQKNTKFNLSNKLKSITDEKINDIIIEFDATLLTNQNFKYIQMFQHILQDSGNIGKMKFDIFNFHIKNLNDYKNNLININDTWYQNKLI